MASHTATVSIPQDGSVPLRAALAYAAKGLRVYPVYEMRGGQCACKKGAQCKHPAKHPRTAHGIKDATTDAATIRGWWRKWPMANVGIATGAENGIMAVDIDPRHGGDKSMAVLEAERGAVKNPIAAETGGGGRHLVFRHPGGTVKNATGIRPGIDVRGDGGGIVVWPSTHKSGSGYRWATGQSLLERKPTALPAKWRQWLEEEGIIDNNPARTTQRDRRDRESEAVALAVPGKRSRGDKRGDRAGGASLPLCVDATLDLNGLTADEQAKVRRAIKASVPSASGTRNRELFMLAKRLRGIPALAGVNPRCLRPIVDAWYEQAKATMSDEHNADDCWAQFLYDWPRVKHPGDMDVSALAREVVKGPPHPASEALGFTSPHKRALVGLCAKMQDTQGDSPFFLSCRDAADALTAALGTPIDHKACSIYLGALVAAGVLVVVVKGDTKRATRYRFVWRDVANIASGPPRWLQSKTDSAERTKRDESV